MEKLQAGFADSPRVSRPSISVSLRISGNCSSDQGVFVAAAKRLAHDPPSCGICQTYRQHFPAESEPAAASGWSCEA